MSHPDFILQVNGRTVRPFNYDSREWDAAAVAHSLSQINRYTGHAKYPWSVGAHTILAERIMFDLLEDSGIGVNSIEGLKYRLATLIHDAAEAYLNDVSTPVKYHKHMTGYRIVEDSIMEHIFELHRIEPTAKLMSLIDLADKTALSNVVVELMPKHECWIALNEKYPPTEVYRGYIYEHHWRDVKQQWIDRYVFLYGTLQNAIGRSKQ